MKKFTAKVNNKAAVVNDNLTELIITCYEMIDRGTLVNSLSIQEDSWKVDEKGNPKNGRVRVVAFEKIDEFVRDGEVLEDLSFFYPNPLLTNIGRN